MKKHEWDRRNDAVEATEGGITNKRTAARRTSSLSSACATAEHKDLDRRDDESATEINLSNNTDSDGTFQCLSGTRNFFKIRNKHVSWKEWPMFDSIPIGRKHFMWNIISDTLKQASPKAFGAETSELLSSTRSSVPRAKSFLNFTLTMNTYDDAAHQIASQVLDVIKITDHQSKMRHALLNVVVSSKVSFDKAQKLFP